MFPEQREKMRALFLLKIIEHNFPAAFPAQNPKKNENMKIAPNIIATVEGGKMGK